MEGKKGEIYYEGISKRREMEYTKERAARLYSLNYIFGVFARFNGGTKAAICKKTTREKITFEHKGI